MTTGTTVSILPCGAMTADLTWLLLAPGRAIRNRQNKHLPADGIQWVVVLPPLADRGTYGSAGRA